MKKILTPALFFAGSLILLISSCQRHDMLQPLSTDPLGPVNDLIQVTANVTGVVLDENNTPLAGATVTSGAATTTTNNLGIFYLGNISLSKSNGSVIVTKAGYYKGVRSFKTTAGKNHQVKIQLMQRVLSGTLNSVTGGNISSNGTATINFPANAFVTNTGAAYSGTVKVYSRWIDPAATNLPAVMPGDLRGLRTNNTEDLLRTYGMIGAELEDGAGNILSLAPGKKAAITIPIPAAQLSTAPDTIVLFHFDNATARWKEEGTAVKVGSAYQAQVNKFSFWNGAGCTHIFTLLSYTLINAANNTPFAGVTTSVRVLANGDKAYGVTNDDGFVSGYVFKDQPLVLEVYGGECPTPIYSQNIGPFSSSINLGNINVSLPASKYITFSGKIVNCNAAPVTNGYISLLANGGNHGFATPNATGNFSFSILNCTGNNLNYSYYVVDNAAAQQSSILTGTSTPAGVNLGTITACGSVASAGDIFVSGSVTTGGLNQIGCYWKNGIFTAISNGNTNIAANSIYVSGNDVYLAGEEFNVNTNNYVAKFWKNGTETTLSNATSSHSTAVFVSGGNVYVIGTETTGFQRTAKLWKNGVSSTLVDGRDVTAIFVSGNDVYVAGETQSFNAVLWKNGNIIFTHPHTHVVFNSIFVLGTDVYLAGFEYDLGIIKNIAKTWKNGVETNLTNGTASTDATGIFVSGNDVYAVGQESNPVTFKTRAKLWKNGVETNLTNGLSYAFATGVKVVGTDVYVCGREQQLLNNNYFDAAMLWKNGFPINLSTGPNDAYATSLFVK